LYAVAGDFTAPIAAELTGVGGSVVRPVRAAGLTAIVGDVDQPDFGEAALRRNLEDLDWLEQTARAHHAVIEAAARRGPVIPMRLATVYNSDAGVAGTLHERSADFRQALSRVSACSEWGVKGYTAKPADQGPADQGPADQGPADQGPADQGPADQGPADQGPADQGPADQGPAVRGTASGSQTGGRDGSADGPGAAYLRRRRAQLAAQDDARQESMASAQVVYAELGRLSVSARLYPPQSPELTGQPVSMVLNAAYLVADERADAFAAAVADLAAQHRSVQLNLTGPWPAYSFVGMHEAEGLQ
jgi:hypothetical protein